MALKIHVILGSTRPGRFSEKPGKWILGELQKKEGIEAELIDLRDWPLPFFNEPKSPSHSNGEYSTEVATKWAKKVGEADGFIIVTPEYNHGYPAVLKNALDYVYDQWNNKPVGFVSYGGVSGGTRSVQQLRQVAIELQMVPIRNGIHFPLFWDHLDEKGELKTEAHTENAGNFLDQLLAVAGTLKQVRAQKEI